MLISVALTLSLAGLLQQSPCKPGEVLDVTRRRDYLLNVCGIGEIALRGVEPPLGVATGFHSLGPTPPGSEPNAATSGEILGRKDLGPQGIEFLRGLLSGKRIAIVHDGFRIGDLPGRQYAYVFLPDKTLINAELIKRGFGYADRQGSHPRRKEFLAIEEAARREKAGVWAS